MQSDRVVQDRHPTRVVEQATQLLVEFSAFPGWQMQVEPLNRKLASKSHRVQKAALLHSIHPTRGMEQRVQLVLST